MSETNFTEQDRLILSGGFYAMPSSTRTAGNHAIAAVDSLLAERDSLRAQLGEAQTERDGRGRAALTMLDMSNTLRSENERLREALRLIQWGGERSFPFCPKCKRFDRDGHASDCEVGAALAGETKPVVAEPRWFPVHPCDRNRIHHVPWSLLDAHEDQALLNHDQSLDRLASRGGLSLCEMRAVISDKYYFELTPMECESAEAFIHTVIAEAQSETGGAA